MAAVTSKSPALPTEPEKQLALRPYPFVWKGRTVDWLPCEKEAIVMRMRYAHNSRDFQLTQDQRDFQEFIQTKVPVPFEGEARCTSLNTLKISALANGLNGLLHHPDIEDVSALYQFFVFIELYFALGQEKNLESARSLFHQLRRFNNMPEMQWVIKSLTDPKLMPLLSQPRIFRPVNTLTLSSPYPDLTQLYSLCLVAEQGLNMGIANLTTKFALRKLVQDHIDVLATCSKQCHGLLLQLERIHLSIIKSAIPTPKILKEHRVLFIDIEKSLTELKRQFDPILQERHANFTRKCKASQLSDPEIKQQVAEFEISLHASISSFQDFVTAMDSTIAWLIKDNKEFAQELQALHQVIKTPYSYGEIHYMHVFFAEFFTAFAALHPEDQTAFFEPIIPFLASTFIVISNMSSRGLHPIATCYKDMETNLTTCLDTLHNFQTPQGRLQKLVMVILPIIRNMRFHYLCHPIAAEKEKKSEDVDFFVSLLQTSAILSTQLYNLAASIQKLPEFEQCKQEKDSQIQEFVELLEDISQNLRSSCPCIASKSLTLTNRREAFIDHYNLMLRCILQITRMENCINSLMCCSLSFFAECNSFLNNLRFYMILMAPAMKYGAELSLLEDDKDHAASAAPKLYPFVSNHDSAAAKAAAPPADESAVAKAAAPQAVQQEEPLAKLIGQLQQIPGLPPFVIGHYLVILNEVLHGHIFFWQPSIVAEEALSKCALLIEQIFKVRAEKETSSMHDLMALSAEANIPLTEDDEKLLEELESLNVNQTHDIKRCNVLLELDRYMQMLDRLHREMPYPSDEKFLQEKYGEKKELWIKCVQDLISEKIGEVKKIIAETIAFAIELSAPFGGAKVESPRLSQDLSPKPDQKHLTLFHKHIEELQQALMCFIQKEGAADCKKVVPIPEESERDIQQRVYFEAKYIQSLLGIFDHLKRALIFPSTNCERTYKTILATTIGKALELVELIALINQPIIDPETGRHILFSTKGEKKVIHSHALEHFYNLLKKSLQLTHTDRPIRPFENHLKIGARYPKLADFELFFQPTGKLLEQGLKIMELAIGLLEKLVSQ